ncbi:MAG TPA: type IV pilus secretin PilQ, partial [Pseudomonas sp.]|nr:type IV pilus secretin PilQ [Pseudomonas sp.]
MNSTLSRVGVAMLALLASPALLAANLNKLDVASLPGDRVELKLAFDEPVSKPRGYTLEQPARIALDLPGVSNKLGVKNRELGLGNARSVTVVEAQGRTRLIVNLASLVPYATRVEGNELFIVLGESEGAVAPIASAAASPVASRPAPVAAKMVGKAISNIDFRRGEDGAGNVVITLSDASVGSTIEEQGGKINVKFDKAQLPEALRVRLDVQDFATPVRFVDATSSSGGASVAIEPSGR